MGSKFLKHPTKPVGVGPKKISSLVDEMLFTGFQGKKLAEAVEVWKDMLEEEKVTIFMGLSGAMVPAGMRKIIAHFIKERMIDVLVSTGANLFHDTHEALGGYHWVGSHIVDDSQLLKEGIDRIYDVFAVEQEFRKTDREVQRFVETLDENYQYSSREFLYLLGKELCRRGAKDSILAEAARNNVPVFCPALCDSSLGYSFLMARRGVMDSAKGDKFIRTGKSKMIFVDQIKDVDETVQIAEKAGKTGVVYIGGGVPKNFIQQTELINLILGYDLPGHEYAIQITTDSPHWGGLSGCTLEEAISWGKISEKAKKVMCFCDATLALPVISHALNEKCSETARKRKKPVFEWKQPLSLKYV